MTARSKNMKYTRYLCDGYNRNNQMNLSSLKQK